MRMMTKLLEGALSKHSNFCRSRNHETAVNWYEKAVNIHTDTTGCFDSTMDSPVYELQAKVAELYLGGEYGLEKDASYSG